MPSPDVLSGPFAEGRRSLPPPAGRRSRSPAAPRCPARAAGRWRPWRWTTSSSGSRRSPRSQLGAARAPSPAAFVHLCVQLAEDLAAAGCQALEAALSEADLVDAAARAVAGYLDDLPDLPLVGEPFGGEEGTD